jgi:hypothetical protein
MKLHSSFPSSRTCAATAVLLASLAPAPIFAAPALPDFGSPDELASQNGTFELLGIKLGMPVDDALNALKAYDSKLQIGPQSGAFNLLPDLKITPAYVADEILTRGTYDRDHTSPERFLLLTTTAPSKSYVWGIWRVLDYRGDAGKRPLASAFMESVKGKYGAPTSEESYGSLRTYYWYVDKNGKPYHPPKKQSCPWEVTESFDNYATRGFSFLSNWISRGVPDNLSPSKQTMDYVASPACGYAAKLKIRTSVDSEGRISGVEMFAQNFRLGWSSLEMTRKKLVEAQAAKKEQEREHAGQQSGPKL